MAIALLLTLSLVFSSAQVYRAMSTAADVQDVADAVALAAENEVAEFMVIARVCDAVALSLSLTGIVATGLGVAALCTPVTAVASETLLKAGSDILKARDSFAEKASSTLDRLQRALPFIAAASGMSVAAANNGGPLPSSYTGLALLVPTKGEPLSVEGGAGSDLADEVQQQADGIAEAGEAAERAAERANEQKERGFMSDCGAAPGYCMYERAASLSSLPASQNPLYRSVDTWSFSVALDRAKAYYRARLGQEAPEGGSVEEQARSALRMRFYAFASEQVGKGYVHETADSFDALFPRLPKNTDEMRRTELYTEVRYPVVSSGGGLVMHAWSGCPAAAGASSTGSISQMEAGGYKTCPKCGFTASSMGKVAAASTSIENGFEHHYVAIAEACDAYEKARAELDPLAAEVKERAGGLFEKCLDALGVAAAQRIDAQPPGRFGAIALVVAQPSGAPTGFSSAFVDATGQLGARAAVSAATLLGDTAEEGRTVVSSLLDGIADKGGTAVGAAGVMLDCWSALLYAYLNGQQALGDAVQNAVDAIPFASASGLGSWAADAFEQAVETLGLQPAKLDALKPVLVNSAHVASADGEGAVSARLLSLKQQAVANPSSTTDVFSSVVSGIEQQALEGVAAFDGRVEIASIRLFGDDGPAIPITVALPPAAKDAASTLIGDLANTVRSVYANVTGVRVWE